MTTVICSGTVFSNWQENTLLDALANPESAPVCKTLSLLIEKACQQQFPDKDELEWKPFSPSEELTDQVGEVLSSMRNESIFAWADNNCGLCLDFLQTSIDGAKFLLFYSSPEYELSNFIESHPFDEIGVEKVLQAWLIRTRALLAFFMNNRDQCMLVNIQTAIKEPQLFTQAVNHHFKLSLAIIPPVEKERSGNPVLVEYLALSLLLGNELISETYDEIRSASTVICEIDKSFSGIQSRSKSLIDAYLNEVMSFKRLIISHKDLSESNEELRLSNQELSANCEKLLGVNKELEDDQYLKQIQITQLMEELEYYFKSSREQGDVFAKYLGSDPLLSVARLAR